MAGVTTGSSGRPLSGTRASNVSFASSARLSEECAMKHKTKELVRVSISNLKPHPKQAVFFAPSPE